MIPIIYYRWLASRRRQLKFFSTNYGYKMVDKTEYSSWGALKLPSCGKLRSYIQSKAYHRLKKLCTLIIQEHVRVFLQLIAIWLYEMFISNKYTFKIYALQFAIVIREVKEYSEIFYNNSCIAMQIYKMYIFIYKYGKCYLPLSFSLSLFLSLKIHKLKLVYLLILLGMMCKLRVTEAFKSAPFSPHMLFSCSFFGQISHVKNTGIHIPVFSVFFCFKDLWLQCFHAFSFLSYSHSLNLPCSSLSSSLMFSFFLSFFPFFSQRKKYQQSEIC